MNADLPFHAAVQSGETVVRLPFATIGLLCVDEQIAGMRYLPASTPETTQVTGIAAEAKSQLLAYARNARFRFSLPLAPAGTAFQRAVWNALQAIPPGSVRHYGDLAEELGSAARAVGQACGANPYAPVVPCHRVVAKAGLGGFAHSSDPAGELLGIKRRLLMHEGWRGAA